MHQQQPKLFRHGETFVFCILQFTFRTYYLGFAGVVQFPCHCANGRQSFTILAEVRLAVVTSGVLHNSVKQLGVLLPFLPHQTSLSFLWLLFLRSHKIAALWINPFHVRHSLQTPEQVVDDSQTFLKYSDLHIWQEQPNNFKAPKTIELVLFIITKWWNVIGWWAVSGYQLEKYGW